MLCLRNWGLFKSNGILCQWDIELVQFLCKSLLFVQRVRNWWLCKGGILICYCVVLMVATTITIEPVSDFSIFTFPSPLGDDQMQLEPQMVPELLCVKRRCQIQQATGQFEAEPRGANCFSWGYSTLSITLSHPLRQALLAIHGWWNNNSPSALVSYGSQAIRFLNASQRKRTD